VKGSLLARLALFPLISLIGGGTWLVISFQTAANSLLAAVGWRFTLAALLLAMLCRWRGVSLMVPRQHLPLLAILGLCNFGLNFWLFYHATTMLPSGLVGTSFIVLVLVNLIGDRIFFGVEIPKSALLGSVIAIIGMVMLFLPEMDQEDGGNHALIGLLTAIAGMLSASIGNLLQAQAQRQGLAILPTLTIAMASGGASMLLLALLLGDSLAIPLNSAYLASLGYLVLVASFVVYPAYMVLIREVGPGAAAYSTVGIPLVALVLSTLFEGYHWRSLSLSGAIMLLSGMILMLHRGVTRRDA
jgi:drug/metabolite transporter (DMT)-like permease